MPDERPHEVDPDPDETSLDESRLDQARWSTTPADPTEAVRVVSASDDPPFRFGPDETGPLPHWTEPPTGEMTRAVDDDDLPWARLTDEPRWGDEADALPPVAVAPVGRAPLFGDDPAPPPLFGQPPADGGVAALDDVAPARAAATFGAEPPLADPTPIPGARPVTSIRTDSRSHPPRPLDDGSFTATRGTGGRNMPQAVAVGAGLGLAYILLAKFGGPKGLMALVVVVLALAAAELYESQRKAGYAPATFVGIAATVGLPLAAYWKGESAVMAVMFVSVVVVLLWLLTSGTLDSAPMPNASATLLGVVYIGFMGAHGALILRQPDGVGTVTTLAVAVVAYDVFGLLIGSAVGRSPLIRWVSPNKTVEGLLGGAVGVFVSMFILCGPGGLHPWSDRTVHWLQLAVVVAVAAPIGDLVESMLKRSLGVKDMGDLLPGHGGVLDRFDAFLFVLPAAYYLGVVLNVPAIR